MSDTEKDPWEPLRNNLEYFKKSEVPLDLFDLPNFDYANAYKAKYDAALALGYVWFARYWASAFLDLHIAFKWNADVASEQAAGLSQKKAWTAADKRQTEYTKDLKKYA